MCKCDCGCGEKLETLLLNNPNHVWNVYSLDGLPVYLQCQEENSSTTITMVKWDISQDHSLLVDTKATYDPQA